MLDCEEEVDVVEQLRWEEQDRAAEAGAALMQESQQADHWRLKAADAMATSADILLGRLPGDWRAGRQVFAAKTSINGAPGLRRTPSSSSTTVLIRR